MSKFLVFAGTKHNPSGGWGDYESAHETYEDARSACLALMGLGGPAKDMDVADWSHVVDLATCKIVFQAHGQTLVNGFKRERQLHCVAWDSQGNMQQSLLTL